MGDKEHAYPIWERISSICTIFMRRRLACPVCLQRGAAQLFDSITLDLDNSVLSILNDAIYFDESL